MRIYRNNATPRSFPLSNFSGIELGPGPTRSSPLQSGSDPMRVTARSAPEPQFPNCSICNKSVDVANTKMNELGRPVHEECHALNDSLKKATIPLSTANDVADIDGPLFREIIKLLNSAQNDTAAKACTTCGSSLEYCNATVIYRGRTWGIPLPVCTLCYSNFTSGRST
jgi:hypothetical protein